MVDSPSRSSGAGVGPWTLVIAAIVLAAVFGRLGVWQLDRLAERRELNRTRLARLAQPPLDLALPGEPPSEDQLAWRRVRTANALL